MITLSGIGKKYGSRIILRNISFTIHSGEIALLVGPNGIGKSTLLKSMAGIIRPDKGHIDYACNTDEIAYLGHATVLYNDLTAIENLRFWEGIYGGDTAASRLISALRRVGLEPFIHERAGTFSRGMMQRLNLARVLLRNPKLLLLDEPATGLDRASITLLRTEIVNAKKRGAAIIWITHTPAEDIVVADTVIELADGTIVFNNTAQQWHARILNQNDSEHYLPSC